MNTISDNLLVTTLSHWDSDKPVKFSDFSFSDEFEIETNQDQDLIFLF